MSRASQKDWTKTMAMLRLREINKAYEDVAKLAEHGGKMPARLRNMLKSASKKNEAVLTAFKEWQP